MDTDSFQKSGESRWLAGVDGELSFFDEAGFEGHGDAVDAAVDFVVSVDEADVFTFGTAFEDLGGAAEFEVFDEHDVITIGEFGAVSVFDDAGGFGFGVLGPLMTAGGAFPFGGMAQHIIEGANRAGGSGHRRERRSGIAENGMDKLGRQLLRRKIRKCHGRNTKCYFGCSRFHSTDHWFDFSFPLNYRAWTSCLLGGAMARNVISSKVQTRSTRSKCWS